jgi:mRNA guanylyltransferase
MFNLPPQVARASAPMSRIPDIPGFHVPRGSDQESWLKGQVARLCRLDHNRYVPVFCTSAVGPPDSLIPFRFPGSQPVSFSMNHLAELERREYFTYSS